MKSKFIIPILATAFSHLGNAAYLTPFSAWSNTGDASLVDDVAFLTTAASDGFDDSANLNRSNVGPVVAFDLQTFAGLGSSPLDNATEGSAMKQTFSVLAGERISINWQFLTNENTAADFAFIVLDGVFTELTNSGLTSAGASYGFDRSISGTYTSAPFANDSTVTFAIGIAETTDFSVSSALRVNSIIPEPSALMMLGLGMAGLCVRRRRA